MEFNPWKVLSLEAFHYYCCPECEDRYKTKDQFIDHAFGEHPKALDTIPGIVDTKVPIPNKLPEPSKPKQDDIESNVGNHEDHSDCEVNDDKLVQNDQKVLDDNDKPKIESEMI